MATGQLIGRDRELDELEARVRAHRLVTVIGPGGVGKTAVAMAVAARVADGFPLGVRLADLTRVEDERSVQGALAAQLGFDSFDALLSSPNDRPLLLVVDNCEHLLDAVASAIARALGACRQPTVLATSRSPRELPGESVMALAPLALPYPPGNVASSPSVQLFLSRCRDAGASLEGTDLRTVVELCRRLDGLPLAIEIAAARARTMSVAEIAAKLDEGVDVLDRPRFRGDPRHRGVAQTLRWSYDLLDRGPAELLARLAVFGGTFTASAARAVAPTEHVDEDLDELVHAALVVADTSGPATRYRLLDSVRRFAAERLRERDELAPTADRFVDHVIESTRARFAGSAATWRPGVLREAVAAFDGVAEALRWCIAHDEDPARAHRLAAGLWAVVHQGRADEIVDLMRQLLARFPERTSRGAVQALAVLATAEYVTGHPDVALRLAGEALGASSDGAPSPTLHRVLGQARNALGDRGGAIEAFMAGVDAAEAAGATAVADELRVAAAQVIADAGRVDEAISLIDGVIARADAGGSMVGAAWARATRAWILLRTDPRAGLADASAGVREAREIDYPIAIAVDLRTIAFAHLLLGDLPAATRALADLYDDLVGRGALSNARVLLDVAAVLAHRAGHPAWEALAATARATPITTMASGTYDLVPLPATDAAPIARHDAVAGVRDLLGDLRSGAWGVAAPPGTGAAPAVAHAAIRRLGDVYELEFEGSSITVRTSKGVEDIARLVAAGGREIAAVELADAAVEQGSTGEVIDAAARRRYEERIRDLQDEIDEAERDHDHERAYRHQAELDALIDHLSAALGRGGRGRRGASNAERARSAVTHRIRSAIRQLTKLHLRLGHHLDHAIQTGTYCSYRPEHPVEWDVR